MNISSFDKVIIGWSKKLYVPVARLAIFIIYFYFGILKILRLSPASPLAESLTAKTVGAQHFDSLFIVLAVFECVIGILFLFPKLTRVVIPLLFVHLLVVCSPLVLLPSEIWVHPFVPSLEGQYIIKNVALIAIAMGIAATTAPLKKPRK